MSLKKLNLQNLKDSIELVRNTGCHSVWVTDRWKYWQRDIDKWCPQELQERVSIASRKDFVSDGLPCNTGLVLVDGLVDVTGDFRMMYAKEALRHSPMLEPQPTLDSDLIGDKPRWSSNPIEDWEVPC